MSDPAVPSERLLEHQDFLRALARELLGDPSSAEDVLQDAYLKALTHPPREAGALRAWLARVVTNRARNLRREERRRSARERETARPELALETDLDERIETQQRVLDALRRMREPYRSTLWLRWFEGLPPREIARRMDTGIETVRSRLQRGLVELRRELDREFGERRAWCIALAPWLARRTSTAMLTTAGLTLLAALAVLGWGASRGFAARETARTVALARAAQAAPALEDDPDGHVRQSAAALSHEEILAAVVAAETLPFVGCAVDAHTGEPIPELALESGAPSARTTSCTAADGSFRLADGRDLIVSDAGQVLAANRSRRGLEVVIGPTLRLAFLGALPCAPGELVATLDGGACVPVREGSDPWVRFPALAPLSLLSCAERSACELVVTTRDGRYAGRARVHARLGIHPERVQLKLAPCAEPQAATSITADAPRNAPVRGRVSSRAGLPLAGCVRARSLDRPARSFDTPLVDGAFAFEALPRGRWEILPPLDDGFAWSPPSARVEADGASALAFERRDQLRSRRVRVRARESAGGARVPELRFALLPDRSGSGKRAALDYQGEPQLRSVPFDDTGYAALPLGTACFWVAERDGFLSARGTQAELREEDGDWLLELELAPSWRTHLFVLGDEDGALVPLGGVELVTAGGKALAASFEDGRIDLELAYEPGRLSIVLPGWRVESWEGWSRGYPRSALDPHRVVLVRE